MVGERRLELPASWSRTKRATRLRYSPTDEFKLNDFLQNVQSLDSVDNGLENGLNQKSQ